MYKSRIEVYLTMEQYGPRADKGEQDHTRPEGLQEEEERGGPGGVRDEHVHLVLQAAVGSSSSSSSSVLVPGKHEAWKILHRLSIDLRIQLSFPYSQC